MTWRTMDSAPKSGRILVTNGTWDGEVHGIDTSEKGPWLVEADTMWVVGTDCYVARIIEPKLWSPIPKPPEQD